MTSSQSFDSINSEVIAPYGNELINLMVEESKKESIKKEANKKLECSHRNACDIELLVVGGFSPLQGFMLKADYESVVKNHRTSSGKLFGLPIVLDTDREDFVVGDKQPYEYLVESIDKFINQEELIDCMKSNNFTNCKYRNFNGGIVALHSGWKV